MSSYLSTKVIIATVIIQYILFVKLSFFDSYIAGLVQDCSMSIVNALDILLPCTKPSISNFSNYTVCLLPDTDCPCAGNDGDVSPPPRVSDPAMHHGRCTLTHVPWCMLRSLTRSGWHLIYVRTSIWVALVVLRTPYVDLVYRENLGMDWHIFTFRCWFDRAMPFAVRDG